jgi:epoxyqueuosine reductase QueG
MDMHIGDQIVKFIKDAVLQAQTVTRYREPLVGFASAYDHLFTQIKQVIGPHHMHPREMLTGAKTVVAFFIPFAEDIVKANRRDADAVAREWAVAYIETNQLISQICARLIQLLQDKGIEAVAEKPTHNFNEQDLTAGWSHKSVAYIAGLGTFGLNRLLITPSGCAGRLGSLVISAEIPPTPRPTGELCRYYREGKCLYCVNNCPIKALQIQQLDKQRCYRRLLEVDSEFSDLGLCDVCGKCAMGPCAINHG